MTTQTAQTAPASTITPINPKEAAQMEFRQVALKISPAEFSRMIGVSKTSVSNWLKEGRIVADAAGKIEPKKAVEQILRTTNPAKLRPIFFKNITNDTETLQNEIIRLNRKISTLESQVNERVAETKEIIEGCCLLFVTADTILFEEGTEEATKYLEKLQKFSGIISELQDSEIIQFNCDYLKDAEPEEPAKNVSQNDNDFNESDIVDFPDLDGE